MMGLGMFPPPEVDQHRAVLNTFSAMEQANIVAFLKTLSDGYSKDKRP
jgi:hypothetical protein